MAYRIVIFAKDAKAGSEIVEYAVSAGGYLHEYGFMPDDEVRRLAGAEEPKKPARSKKAKEGEIGPPVERFRFIVRNNPFRANSHRAEAYDWMTKEVSAQDPFTLQELRDTLGGLCGYNSQQVGSIVKGLIEKGLLKKVK